MDSITLGYLRLLLLVTDGIGIVASYQIAQYYNSGVRWAKFYKNLLRGQWTELESPLGSQSAIRPLYLFWIVLTGVFLFLTVSDILVIQGFPQSWATLPIVRGLVFRLPITIVELWLIHIHHVRRR
jgi:hypothetical protein